MYVYIYICIYVATREGHPHSWGSWSAASPGERYTPVNGRVIPYSRCARPQWEQQHEQRVAAVAVVAHCISSFAECSVSSCSRSRLERIPHSRARGT